MKNFCCVDVSRLFTDEVWLYIVDMANKKAAPLIGDRFPVYIGTYLFVAITRFLLCIVRI